MVFCGVNFETFIRMDFVRHVTCVTLIGVWRIFSYKFEIFGQEIEIGDEELVKQSYKRDAVIFLLVMTA